MGEKKFLFGRYNVVVVVVCLFFSSVFCLFVLGFFVLFVCLFFIQSPKLMRFIFMTVSQQH